jgi:hypothetical protein
MDFSKLSDDDLKAIASNNLQGVSDAGLRMLSGSAEVPQGTPMGQEIVVTPQGASVEGKPVQQENLGLPQRSIAEDIGRQLGLTARAGVTGLSALPTMAADALNLGLNFLPGVNIQPASKSLQQLMNSLNLPQPETATERVSQDIASAMSGVGGAVKLASKLPQQMAAPFVNNAGLQTAGAASGSLASGVARENDASPITQALSALLIGSLAPTTATTAVARTAEGAKRLVQPFTQGGREKVTGEVLRSLARNPDEAAKVAQSYTTSIKGYQPTTAQATRDVGLVAAETPIRALDTTGRFAEQASVANQARISILDRMAKDEDAVLKALTKREEVTAPLREQSFAQSVVTPEMFKSAVTLTVGKVANNIANSPSGKRETVINVIDDSVRMIQRANTPQDLYEIRKDLRAAAQGLLDKSGSGGPSAGSFKVAKNELNQIIRAVDDAIEAAAPGYKNYLDKYSKLSKSIESMEAAQTFRNKVLTTTPDPMNAGNFLISQPAFARTIRNLESTKSLKGLSKPQISVLKNVSKDLDEGVLNRATKVPGSDTFKNMSTANVIGGIIGKQLFGEVSPLLQKISAPMNWLYNGTDDAIRELIVSSMLDPKLASRLMANATQTTMETIGKELQRKALTMGFGATFGIGQ